MKFQIDWIANDHFSSDSNINKEKKKDIHTNKHDTENTITIYYSVSLQNVCEASEHIFCYQLLLYAGQLNFDIYFPSWVLIHPTQGEVSRRQARSFIVQSSNLV